VRGYSTKNTRRIGTSVTREKGFTKGGGEDFDEASLETDSMRFISSSSSLRPIKSFEPISSPFPSQIEHCRIRGLATGSGERHDSYSGANGQRLYSFRPWQSISDTPIPRPQHLEYVANRTSSRTGYMKLESYFASGCRMRKLEFPGLFVASLSYLSYECGEISWCAMRGRVNTQMNLRDKGLSKEAARVYSKV
jgi:hypothetical protein